MKNKRVLMLLALTTVLSVSMTACNFGGGSDEDSSVVQVTPTPEPTKAAKATPTLHRPMPRILPIHLRTKQYPLNFRMRHGRINQILTIC